MNRLGKILAAERIWRNMTAHQRRPVAQRRKRRGPTLLHALLVVLLLAALAVIDYFSPALLGISQ